MNAAIKTIVVAVSFFVSLAAVANAQETLVVAGTGDSQGLLRALAVSFEKKHPGVMIEVPDSVGTGGGIKAVQTGKAGLGRTARPLKEKERPGLTEVQIGKSPVVFAVNPSLAQVTKLSTEEVTGIYDGRIANWKDVGGPDGKIYPICREEGDSSRQAIAKIIPAFKAQSPVCKEIFTTGETAEAIRDHKNTIGYLPLSMALDYGLKPLLIDGHSPDRKAVSQGDYPFVVPFYLVKHEGAPPLALQFIDFVLSREAGEQMLQQGVVPLQ